MGVRERERGAIMCVCVCALRKTEYEIECAWLYTCPLSYCGGIFKAQPIDVVGFTTAFVMSWQRAEGGGGGQWLMRER